MLALVLAVGATGCSGDAPVEANDVPQLGANEPFVAIFGDVAGGSDRSDVVVVGEPTASAEAVAVDDPTPSTADSVPAADGETSEPGEPEDEVAGLVIEGDPTTEPQPGRGVRAVPDPGS